MSAVLNEPVYATRLPHERHEHHDRAAVSWPAIFAGATAAASLSLILLILGMGLGLSSVSPWSAAGISAGAFGVSTILWLTVTQLAASGMGGYLAGRLRTRWSGTHTDEVYFRDTAHGFLAWGVATLVTAALLSSVTGAIVGGGARVAAAAGGAVATTAATAGVAGAAGMGSAMGSPATTANTSYTVDSLFRKAPEAGASAAPGSSTMAMSGAGPADTSGSPGSTAEVGRIFANGIRTGQPLPPDDVKYVGQQVAQRTGLPQADAEKRVNDAYAQLTARIKAAEDSAREAADKARKAAAWAALWVFVSLLLGAFVASLAATFGGRSRDFDPVPPTL
jgi:hypothetical protein